MAHTKGPWQHDGRGIYIFGPDGSPICQVRGWGRLTGKGGGALGLSDEEAIEIQKANGNLIAAAPDLLAACQAARHGWTGKDVQAMIESALLKAIGE